MLRLLAALIALGPASALVLARSVDMLDCSQDFRGSLHPSEHHDLELVPEADAPTSLRLSGRGNADFDLVVYDLHGRRLGALEGAGSEGVLHISSQRAQGLQIEVVNHGPDAGSYELEVN